MRAVLAVTVVIVLGFILIGLLTGLIAVDTVRNQESGPVTEASVCLEYASGSTCILIPRSVAYFLVKSGMHHIESSRYLETVSGQDVFH